MMERSRVPEVVLNTMKEDVVGGAGETEGTGEVYVVGGADW